MKIDWPPVSDERFLIDGCVDYTISKSNALIARSSVSVSGYTIITKTRRTNLIVCSLALYLAIQCAGTTLLRQLQIIHTSIALPRGSPPIAHCWFGSSSVVRILLVANPSGGRNQRDIGTGSRMALNHRSSHNALIKQMGKTSVINDSHDLKILGKTDVLSQNSRILPLSQNAHQKWNSRIPLK